MSADGVELDGREDVPQPVKKRGRFSQSRSESLENGQARDAVPVEFGDVPEGFVRDELDDDDPDNDPDFEGDLFTAEEEDDDDVYDSCDESNGASLPNDVSRADRELDKVLSMDPGADSVNRGVVRALKGPSSAALAPPEGTVDMGSNICLRPTDRNENDSGDLLRGEGQGTNLPNLRRASGSNSDKGRSSSGTRASLPRSAPRPRTDDHLYFDVDKLDSSDDEADDLHIQGGSSGTGRAGDGSTSIDPGASGFCEGNLDDGSIDEEDDADCEDESGEGDDGDADGPGSEEQAKQGDDYLKFLLGLLTDDIGGNGAPAPSLNDASGNSDALNVVMDDDDDFDYLRESAKVRDDPLEFRDDLQVSQKEVVQLLFNSTETNLRRQTRTQKAKGPLANRQNVPVVVPPPVLHPPGIVPAPSAPVLEKPNGVAHTTVANILPGTPLPTEVPLQPYLGPAQPAFASLSPASLHQYREQLSVHVQLLTHVHAEVMKRTRTDEGEAASHEVNSGLQIQTPLAYAEASQRSQDLIRQLVNNKRISTMYHEMLRSGMGRLKQFSSKLLHRDRDGFSYETQRSSLYDIPSLGLLEDFLNNCKTLSITELPGAALKPFEPYSRKDLSQALLARPQRRQYTASASASKEGWYAWTAEDDTLLAMTVAKYGREFGDYSKDLLPHRMEDDCQRRVRYLSSRRCPDNPVKRQVMHISTPLNKEEVHLVRYGIERYGAGKTDDPEVWKSIQRDLLPNREWSHLQKLWAWRESRRKYKAKYRAKVSEKKKALRSDAARP